MRVPRQIHGRPSRLSGRLRSRLGSLATAGTRKLVLHERRERPGRLRGQLRRGARLDDASAVHDDDLSCLQDGGQAMRDDHGRPPLHDALQGLLHLTLRLRIEGAGRLVHQQDRRVLEHRPRDRDPLLLAPGEGPPELRDLRLQSLRQVGRKLGDAGHARRLPDARGARRRRPVEDVAGDRAPKQLWLLLHIADLIPQPPGLQVADEVAVQRDGALLDVVEPLQQPADSGLPAAAAADKRCE
mmetsp:Transcript_46441/g.132386  ORF Transcript_46441/g.132386 Transcript_46441/m.132386 type:complete len:242 (+) Transcript_46441:2140-2865(+)